MKRTICRTVALSVLAVDLAIIKVGAQSIYTPYTFTTLAGMPGVCGFGDGTGSAATLCYPWGITTDSSGNVYVVKNSPLRLWQISPSGVVTTLATIGPPVSFSSPAGVAVDSTGNIYFVDYLAHVIQRRTLDGQIRVIAGDGVLGSTDGLGSVARFRYPQGIAVDLAGTLYVADRYNHAIRKITPTGADWLVETYAGDPSVVDGSGQPIAGSTDGTGRGARFNQPGGVAVDSAGNVYVADTYNSTIRKITTAREVTTWVGSAGLTGSADGVGNAARFYYTGAVAVDNKDNVYVVDGVNSTIRKATQDRIVRTLAGTPGQVGTTDGIGAAARFRFPHGVAVDSAGNVYVADTDNHTIRKGITPIIIETLDPDDKTTARIPELYPSVLRRNRPENDWAWRLRSPLLLKVTWLPSKTLRAYVTPVLNSGGHNHATSTRPHGWLRKGPPAEPWKDFPPDYKGGGCCPPTPYMEGGSRSYSNYDTSPVFEFQTDQAGVAEIYYVASELSGIEIVTVTSVNPTEQARTKAEQIITIRVPDLQPLGDTADIELIGVKAAHPQSHFGSNDLIRALTALARNYAAENPRESLPSPRLPVNDMSLPTGGLFDVKLPGKEWLTSHIGHRLGFEADVGGAKSGHGLVPPNLTFDRIIKEQGWFTPIPEQDPPHYHLIANKRGRVTIDSPDIYAPEVLTWDSVTRTLEFEVENDNRGGLDADAVVVNDIFAENGVILLTEGFVPLGAMQIRVPTQMRLRVLVPLGVEQFFIRYRGIATAADRPGVAYAFPLSGDYLTKPIPVPSVSSLQNRFSPVGESPIPATAGTWEVELTDPDQEAAVETNLVYNVVVSNETGSRIFLNGLAFQFTSPAPRQSYALDWAPAFLNTGGVIPTNGYRGPLFTLHWLANPPVGSVNSGQVTLNASLPSTPSTISSAFSSPFMLQGLQIRSGTNGVVVSWGSFATNMLLQSAEDLGDEDSEGPEWYTVNLPMMQQGTTNAVTISASGVKSFYRLSSP